MGSKKIEDTKEKIIDIDRKLIACRLLISRVGINNIPFGKLEGKNIKVNFNDWNAYKAYIRDANSQEYRCIIVSELTEHIMFITAWILAAVASVYLWVKYGHTIEILGGLNIATVAALIFLSVDLGAMVVSKIHFLIIPSILNIKKVKKYRDELEKKKKALEDVVKTYEQAMELKQEEDLMSVFSSIKNDQISDLEELYEYTVNTVLKQINDIRVEKQYSQVLKKCKRLLNMAKKNSSMVGSISKIFNIHLLEVNSIIEQKEKSVSNMNLDELFDNFSDYLDRQIAKYDEVNEYMLKTSVEALNTAFKEEI